MSISQTVCYMDLFFLHSMLKAYNHRLA
jgi:hypothetical protein